MKRLSRLLLIPLVLFVCAVTASAADPVVQKMNVRCDVDKHGDCRMTVTAEIRFSEASEPVVLPVGTDVRDISVSGYEISKETKKGNTWVTLQDSAGLTGVQTFVISYEKLRNVTLGEDKAQTMDIQLLWPLWDWQVEKLAFSVSMPEEFDAEPVFHSGYYADRITVDCITDDTMIQGTVQDALLDRESVTLTLQLPKRFFHLQNIPGATDPVVQIVMLALFGVTAVYWLCTFRNPCVKQSVESLTPQGILAWEFPYIAKGGGLDLPLLLSEWGSLGYITLSISAKGRVRAHSRVPMAGERKDYEVQIYRTMFRRDEVCYADTPRFRRIGVRGAKACRTYWNSRLFTPNSGNPYAVQFLVSAIFGLSWFRAIDHLLPAWTWRIYLLIPTLILGVWMGWLLQNICKQLLRRSPGKFCWMVLPILLIVGVLAQFGGGWLVGILSLVLAVLAAVGTFRGGKRTADGLERIAQIQAFRNYIRQADIHHLQVMLHEDGQYFYDLLPYAEALGMGRWFAKRFANIQLEPCAWLDYPGACSGTAIEFYEIYCDLLAKMQGTTERQTSQ